VEMAGLQVFKGLNVKRIRIISFSIDMAGLNRCSVG
jgi:hypothetical protein